MPWRMKHLNIFGNNWISTRAFMRKFMSDVRSKNRTSTVVENLICTPYLVTLVGTTYRECFSMLRTHAGGSMWNCAVHTFPSQCLILYLRREFDGFVQVKEMRMAMTVILQTGPSGYVAYIWNFPPSLAVPDQECQNFPSATEAHRM